MWSLPGLSIGELCRVWPGLERDCFVAESQTPFSAMSFVELLISAHSSRCAVHQSTTNQVSSRDTCGVPGRCRTTRFYRRLGDASAKLAAQQRSSDAVSRLVACDCCRGSMTGALMLDLHRPSVCSCGPCFWPAFLLPLPLIRRINIERPV